MTRTRFAVKVIIVCAAINTTVMASPVTPAPDGYSWIEMKEINGDFLKPAGWHFVYNKGKLMGSFSISRNRPEIGKPVGTRFIVYAVSNLSKIDSKLVSARIPHYVRGLKQHKDYDFMFSEDLTRGSYRGMSVRYRFQSLDGPLVRQQVYLANDRTDLLLVIIFESSEEDWEQAWKTGRVLLDKFVLS